MKRMLVKGLFVVLVATTATTVALAGTVVSIVPTPSIPLSLTGATVSQAMGNFQQVSYELSNISTQRLVAVEVSWKYQFPDGRSITCRSRYDFVFNITGALMPGASQRQSAGIPRGKTNPAPPDQVTGQITFAEFADGTMLGADQGSMSSWVADNFRAEHDACQHLLAVYRARGPEGIKTEIASNSLSDTKEGGVLNEILGRLEQNEGIPAVIARIERGASIKLPPATPSNP